MQASLPVVNIFRQLQSVTPDLVPRLSPSEAANLIWAFAKAGLYFPRLFEVFCTHHLSAGSPWTSIDAGKVLWAQSVMGLSYPALTSEAIATMHEHRYELQAGQAALAAHSFATTALIHRLPVTDVMLNVCLLPSVLIAGCHFAVWMHWHSCGVIGIGRHAVLLKQTCLVQQSRMHDHRACIAVVRQLCGPLELK
jgi:hypothetical protein